MLSKHWIVVSLLLGVAGLVRSGVAVTIDDFSVGPFSVEVAQFETEVVSQTSLPTNHVLGGSRSIALSGLGPSPSSSVRVAVDAVAQEFRYDADRSSSAANFSVRYGWPNGLQANLLADGSNAIVFDFAFADFESGEGYFDITVDTEPGGRYLYVPAINSPGPFSLVLPYRAFQTGPGGANFANVSSISFGTGNGNLRGDFTLKGIHTAFFPDGDYDFDGDVDAADYLVWKDSFGAAGPFFGAYPVDPADGNRNGFVDAADYILWRKNQAVFDGGAVSSHSVPEPCSIWHVMSAAIAATAFLGMRPILASR